MSEKQYSDPNEGPPFDDPSSSLEERMKDPVFLQTQLDAYEKARTETREAYEELLRRIRLTPTRKINPLYYYVSGAAAAVLLVVTGYFFLHASRQAPPLAYTAAKGQQTHVVLPDGSQVWLNSGSRLTYTARTGVTRQATLDGEAYFEVAPDKTAPFHLSAGRTETVVLGTAFDVKAYRGESVSITLLQGSVRVDYLSKNMLLQPGQTVLARADTFARQNSPDTSSVLAWKEGFFYFNGTLDEVARELAHWYDVDVTLRKGMVFKDTVISTTPRNLPLDSVLRRINELGAGHLRREGRTLDVMP
ncbi:FecR family protein [Dinghuibacter silviterrae]|uniref:FecR family protein n=1 Tax=Dinghuibacter silviterrae TaxID=1539049 RepID=A0A4R8DQX4_9BACT|nr:FecR family protein [Dinghuibacter silviterrae]TDW99814.1 FecR family protein [Dinghuibacter silviterrae]